MLMPGRIAMMFDAPSHLARKDASCIHVRTAGSRQAAAIYGMICSQLLTGSYMTVM
jgi:hypothetical protein